MSRYSKQISDLKYSWGFNCAEGEYFFQLFSTDNRDTVVFSVASNTTIVPHPDKPEKKVYSTNELLRLIEAEEIQRGQEIVPNGQKLMLIMELSF